MLSRVFLPLILLSATEALDKSNSKCSFEKEKCVYNIELQQCKDASEQLLYYGKPQRDIISNEIHTMQEQYTKKLADLENKVNQVLLFGGGQNLAVDKNFDLHNAVEVLFDPDPDRKENQLLNEVHEEFTKLRRELNSTKFVLHTKWKLLNVTQEKLNKTTKSLIETTGKLFHTERKLDKSEEENRNLRETLVDRNAKIQEMDNNIDDLLKRIHDLETQLNKTLAENEYLKKRLLYYMRRLNETERALRLALVKYHELNVRHETLVRKQKHTEEQLMECIKGKTSMFCGFEDEDICGFTNYTAPTSSFNWTRSSGKTPSRRTGPSQDHTCQSPRGKYMYIEASGRNIGQRATLISPKYFGPGEQCLTFYYHMYGRHMGTLNVYVKRIEDDRLKPPLFRVFGNQGDLWTKARLPIPAFVAQGGYQVVFESALNNYYGGYQGDMAIDDIKVIDATCEADRIRHLPTTTQSTPQNTTVQTTTSNNVIQSSIEQSEQ